MFTVVKCKVKRKTISNIRKGKFIVFPKHTNAGNVHELLHFAGTPANLSMCRETYAILLGKVIFFVYIVQLPESDIQNFITTKTFFLYRRIYHFFLLFLFHQLIQLFLLTTKEFAAT